RWLSSVHLIQFCPSTDHGRSLDPAVLFSPRGSGVLRLHLFRDRARHLGVVRELHGVGRAALAHRAQLADVAEHVGERHVGPDDGGVAPHLLAADLTTAAVDVANDVADEVARRHHLDVHDRLKELDACLGRTFTHGSPGGNLERDHGAVHLVESAVEQRHLGVDHGEPDQNTGIPHRLNTLLDARNILLGHDATDDFRGEYVALARLIRLETQLHAGELTGTAGLLLVRVVDLGRPGQRLAVGNLRRPDADVDLMRPAQDVDLDVEVQLAHALDAGLAALRIGRHAEGGVLGRQLLQRQRHSLLVRLRLRLDRLLDDGLGELHLLQQYRL